MPGETILWKGQSIPKNSQNPGVGGKNSAKALVIINVIVYLYMSNYVV